MWRHPNGPAIQPALPTTEHNFCHHAFVLGFPPPRIITILPLLDLWLTPHPKLHELLPNFWGQNSCLLCVVHFGLPHLLLSPSRSHLAWGSALHRTDREMITEPNWADVVLIKSWVSHPRFSLGVTSLGLPTNSNRRRTVSEEKPKLFISHFLPFGCPVETRQDIIILFTLQQPGFIQLDPELQLDAVKFLFRVRPFSSCFTVILTNYWPSVCSLKVKLASWDDSYLFMTWQIFLSLIFPVQMLAFGDFSTSCLSDCRTEGELLFESKTVLRETSSVGYIIYTDIYGEIYCVQCWVVSRLQK